MGKVLKSGDSVHTVMAATDDDGDYADADADNDDGYNDKIDNDVIVRPFADAIEYIDLRF